MMVLTLSFVDINNKIKSNCINYTILLGKYFIFKSKYQKTIPNFMDFKYYLKHNLNLEELNCWDERKNRCPSDQMKRFHNIINILLTGVHHPRITSYYNPVNNWNHCNHPYWSENCFIVLNQFQWIIVLRWV